MMLELDGERAIPELMSNSMFTRLIYWEHLERYRMAQEYANGRTILDIACGAGYGTRMLSDATTGRVTGADLSESALEHARTRYDGPGISWMIADAESFDGYHDYNMVVSFETIEHLVDPAAYVDRVFTQLPNGGLFLVSTPIVNFSRYDGFHKHLITEGEFRRMMVDAGFTIVDELLTGFWCSPLRALHARLVQPVASRGQWRIPTPAIVKMALLGIYWESLALVCRADKGSKGPTTAAHPPTGSRWFHVLKTVLRQKSAARCCHPPSQPDAPGDNARGLSLKRMASPKAWFARSPRWRPGAPPEDRR